MIHCYATNGAKSTAKHSAYRGRSMVIDANWVSSMSPYTFNVGHADAKRAGSRDRLTSSIGAQFLPRSSSPSTADGTIVGETTSIKPLFS
jgi:hypothetical protein